MACVQVEVSGVPFVTFVANKTTGGEPANNSFVLRGYVRHWLGQVWAEHDRAKPIDMIMPPVESGQAGKLPADLRVRGDPTSLRSSVTIIASPRPRVGKTLLARLLVDFHRHEGHPVAGYDLNTGEGTLTQFLREHGASGGRQRQGTDGAV
jgi:hypothetical protein